jgi:hypothetical protein
MMSSVVSLPIDPVATFDEQVGNGLFYEASDGYTASSGQYAQLG